MNYVRPTAFKEVAAHAQGNTNMPTRTRKTGTGGDIGVSKLRDLDPLTKERSAKAKGCYGQRPAPVKPVLVAQVASPSSARGGNIPTQKPRGDLKAKIDIGSPRCPKLLWQVAPSPSRGDDKRTPQPDGNEPGHPPG